LLAIGSGERARALNRIQEEELDNYQKRENSQTQPEPAPVATPAEADRETANDDDRARAHDIGVQAVAQALAEAA
jgi:hypothetical protein